MKNTKKIIALSLLASLTVNAVSLTSPQSASISYASIKIDFGIKTHKFQSKSQTFTLKQDEANKASAIRGLMQIRSDMWDKNVPYTLDSKSNSKNTKLRDYLKSKGINSKDEYINRTKWSTDLEKIGIQRLYEVSLTGLSHTRPDGSDCSKAVLPSGTRTYGEILANNSEPYTPEMAFNQWAYGKRTNYGGKSEYQLLIESNGVYNNGNAHLHIILDPEYDRMGLAIINSSDLNYAAVEFGYADKSGSKAVGLVGEYTMDFGKAKAKANNKKESSKDTRAKLEEAVRRNKIQVEAAKLLLKMAPEKVAGVKGQLLKLIKESEELIKIAEKSLK